MLIALVLFTLAAPTEPPKAKELPAEAKKELKKLEGKWRMVRLVDAEKDSGLMKDADAYYVFKGTELTVSYGEKSTTLLITAIDTSADPKCIDLTEMVKDKPGRTLEGVYKIDGDTLLLAVAAPKEGKERPTGFEKPTGRVVAWTFKRVNE